MLRHNTGILFGNEDLQFGYLGLEFVEPLLRGLRARRKTGGE